MILIKGNECEVHCATKVSQATVMLTGVSSIGKGVIKIQGIKKGQDVVTGLNTDPVELDESPSVSIHFNNDASIDAFINTLKCLKNDMNRFMFVLAC